MRGTRRSILVRSNRERTRNRSSPALWMWSLRAPCGQALVFAVQTAQREHPSSPAADLRAGVITVSSHGSHLGLGQNAACCHSVCVEVIRGCVHICSLAQPFAPGFIDQQPLPSFCLSLSFPLPHSLNKRHLNTTSDLTYRSSGVGCYVFLFTANTDLCLCTNGTSLCGQFHLETKNAHLNRLAASVPATSSRLPQ